MRVFQSTYVGRNDFPKTLPDFLLRQWFTLNARDRRAIRKAFRSRQWIGAALQLGFLGMTGTTLRSLEFVPAAVLHHLGRQFKITFFLSSWTHHKWGRYSPKLS